MNDGEDLDDEDGRDRCQACGSDDLEAVEGEYFTGVVAPDGGRERWAWIGVRCRVCGEKEER